MVNTRREAPSAPLKGELLSVAKLRGFLAQFTDNPLRFAPSVPLTGCFLKSGVTGGFYPPLQGVCNPLRHLKFRHGDAPCLKNIQSPPHARKLGMGRLFARRRIFLPVVSFGHKAKEEST